MFVYSYPKIFDLPEYKLLNCLIPIVTEKHIDNCIVLIILTVIMMIVGQVYQVVHYILEKVGVHFHIK